MPNDSTNTTDQTPDLIPLAAGAVALGYTPASAIVLLSKGRFPVPVHKQGRYNTVARADVEAVLQARPHLTNAHLAAVEAAHQAGAAEDSMSPRSVDDPVVTLLAGKPWITTAEVAELLGITPAVLKSRHAAGKLPFALESDPESNRGGRRASSLEVARYLATQAPAWPTAEEFSAVPSLGLGEVKQALGDNRPAGANDAATEAFLASRETISLADFALMLGISPDTLKRRVQRGQVETVEDHAATGTQRKLKRIRSEYAEAQLHAGG
ncbi:hypothetical protein [Arthrobacter sp. 162MFSha1.1]|uniref:hypothetical protein n=1 Tax=Arthrobacter sp. 162MFSha1.1 TaxID=1151119 RepID=UPI00036A4CE6|nr:hypothetical protein [Arthrobacter sp. 162MFSha1.1]